MYIFASVGLWFFVGQGSEQISVHCIIFHIPAYFKGKYYVRGQRAYVHGVMSNGCPCVVPFNQGLKVEGRRQFQDCPWDNHSLV